MSTVLPTYQPVSYTGTPSAVPNNQQVVIPQITIPNPYNAYNQLMQSMQTPQIQQPSVPSGGIRLHYVKGMDGAKQFVTEPNSMYALFDEDNDVMFIKETDKNNYPIRCERFVYIQEDEPAPKPEQLPATKSDFDLLLKKISELQEEIAKLKGDKDNAK